MITDQGLGTAIGARNGDRGRASCAR